MPIAIVSWRTWMLRKGFQPNKKARSIQQKARLPNDWTQGTEMTPDSRRGSFHVPGRDPGSLLTPSKRGLGSLLTGGVSYHRRHTPSTATRFPSPYGGGKWPLASQWQGYHRNKKEAGKIRPNTNIISYSRAQVNGKTASDVQNLCPAQKQMCAFGKHSVLKSSEIRVIL